MDPQSSFTFQDLFTFVISDMAKAISQRSGETGDQHFARSRAAAHMILGFLPRDVIEAMLAGHCVMVHEVMIADAHNTLHGDAAAPQRRRPRCNIVGLNRAFNDNLDRLELYQQRPAAGSRDAPQALPPAEPHAMPPNVQPEATEAPHAAPQKLNRAARRQAARAENRAALAASRAAPKPGVATPQSAVQDLPQAATSSATANLNNFGTPSPEAIAACNANPEAMAALRAGDPAAFARAMGIAEPCEEFLSAAKTKGSPFDQMAAGPWPDVVPAAKP